MTNGKYNMYISQNPAGRNTHEGSSPLAGTKYKNKLELLLKFLFFLKILCYNLDVGVVYGKRSKKKKSFIISYY